MTSRCRSLKQLVTDPEALTPVERRGDVWLKRDDLFELGGARGGKARAARAFSGLTCMAGGMPPGLRTRATVVGPAGALLPVVLS